MFTINGFIQFYSGIFSEDGYWKVQMKCQYIFIINRLELLVPPLNTMFKLLVILLVTNFFFPIVFCRVT